MTDENKKKIDHIENILKEDGTFDDPNGVYYLGFGEWYNAKTKNLSRVSSGAFMRFPKEMYEGEL